MWGHWKICLWRQMTQQKCYFLKSYFLFGHFLPMIVSPTVLLDWHVFFMHCAWLTVERLDWPWYIYHVDWHLYFHWREVSCYLRPCLLGYLLSWAIPDILFAKAQIPLHRLCDVYRNFPTGKFTNTNRESPRHKSRHQLSWFVLRTFVFCVRDKVCRLCRRLCCQLSPCVVTGQIPLEWHKRVCRGLVTDLSQASRYVEIVFVRDFHVLCLRFSPKLLDLSQGDHLSEKCGNVREFETCHGNVGDSVNSQGNVREKILLGKSVLELFITSWIFSFNSIFFLLASLEDLFSHTFKFAVPVSRFCLPLLFKLH